MQVSWAKYQVGQITFALMMHLMVGCFSKCDTTGYFKGEHRTISSHVCGDQNRNL